MSSSGVSNNNNNQVAANVLPSNPFRNCKLSINFNPQMTAVSNMPDEIATLIFSKMAIEQVEIVLDSTNTVMGADRYSLYRNLVGMKSSLTGKELIKFQRLLSMEGQTLIAGQDPVIRSWSDILKDKPIVLSELTHLDLSDSTNIAEADLIALTKDCKKLTKLVLPAAFPSDEVMAVLRTNSPQAAIYPSAMTEHEWAHPAEFMAKLPPPPQEIQDFINSPRPIWEGKTSAEMHMVMPKVNKIVRNIDNHLVIMPWTLKNVDELDKATGGVGCNFIWDNILQPANDKPSEVGFEWIVFTKDVLPNSRSQSYDNQKQLVEHWGYEMPGFIDATTCMLWENRLSNNRIYNDNPLTYTRCKEKIGGWQLVAGGFAPVGMRVDGDFYDYVDIGVGGLRKF